MKSLGQNTTRIQYKCYYLQKREHQISFRRWSPHSAPECNFIALHCRANVNLNSFWSKSCMELDLSGEKKKHIGPNNQLAGGREAKRHAIISADSQSMHFSLVLEVTVTSLSLYEKNFTSVYKLVQLNHYYAAKKSWKRWIGFRERWIYLWGMCSTLLHFPDWKRDCQVAGWTRMKGTHPSPWIAPALWVSDRWEGKVQFQVRRRRN